MNTHLNLQQHFGNIDIYLFDQLLKGRITPKARVLDAGCGSGRNLLYFFREGNEVCAIDEAEDAIDHVREVAAMLAPHLPRDNFRVEQVEQMSLADSSFDFVISNSVLHFARSEEHWRQMVSEMWRVLAPGGILFARLASTTGIENRVERIEGRRFRLPDGVEWFLVDEAMLLDATRQLGGEMIELIKTTIVQGRRAMTTWCLTKPLPSKPSS